MHDTATTLGNFDDQRLSAFCGEREDLNYNLGKG